jgi:hypothetical protein
MITELSANIRVPTEWVWVARRPGIVQSVLLLVPFRPFSAAGTVAKTNERFIMNSVMFMIVAIFIGVVALFIFGGVFMTFRSVFRHRGMIQQVTDEALRQSRGQTLPQQPSTEPQSSAPSDYACDHCGASLGARTEISPSGDFKCEYCDSWSNIKS